MVLGRVPDLNRNYNLNPDLNRTEMLNVVSLLTLNLTLTLTRIQSKILLRRVDTWIFVDNDSPLSEI